MLAENQTDQCNRTGSTGIESNTRAFVRYNKSQNSKSVDENCIQDKTVRQRG